MPRGRCFVAANSCSTANGLEPLLLESRARNEGQTRSLRLDSRRTTVRRQGRPHSTSRLRHCVGVNLHVAERHRFDALLALASAVAPEAA